LQKSALSAEDGLKEIPKTRVGKFNKRELRKLYADNQLTSL
jgi:acyl-coenzyme A synthetase/AMP-(fatty) acid ligase